MRQHIYIEILKHNSSLIITCVRIKVLYEKFVCTYNITLQK
jgi:hypothetical protein